MPSSSGVGAVSSGGRDLSGGRSRIEHMFDGSLPEIAELGSCDDAALAAAAAGWARVEAAAAARKQAAMAELFYRRTGLDDAVERQLWWVDPDTAVGAELAAAQHIGQGMALSQAHRGLALRDRLPKVAALFEAGLISDLLVRTIVYRTGLILGADTWVAIDTALAEVVARWGAWSAKKIERAIDALVEAHDPAAVRRARQCGRSRFVDVGSPIDEPGFTSVHALLLAPDAAALDERLTHLAYSVCPDDPRTLNERRADALRALTAGHEMLACACGQPDCAAAPTDRPPKDTVIHIVAHADAMDQVREAGTAAEPGSGDVAQTPAAVAEDATVKPPAKPAQSGCAAPAVVLGGGVIDADVLSQFVSRATVRTIVHPGDALPEPHYRPSRALDEFVRCRDLTCRFPGCDRPAHQTDLDHTIPYPHGPTCASNLVCLCRMHHLLKTFWTGDQGWRVQQFPDATLVWTAPTGQTYTTHPGSALLFPDLARPTAPVTAKSMPTDKAPTGDRGAMMPRRRRTRAKDRAYRIDRERQANTEHPDFRDHTRPPPF